MNALVIDDSSAMRRILKRSMTSIGYDSLEAADGVQGLKQMNERGSEVDLVLVDWNMPNMNGLEFVKAFRANPDWAGHKIVMVTSETSPTRMAQALMAGVDEFVMKPFTDDILQEKLKLIGVKAK